MPHTQILGLARKSSQHNFIFLADTKVFWPVKMSAAFTGFSSFIKRVVFLIVTLYSLDGTTMIGTSACSQILLISEFSMLIYSISVMNFG